jgi:hypothetical protein
MADGKGQISDRAGIGRRRPPLFPRLPLGWNVPVPELMVDPVDIAMARAGIPLSFPDGLTDPSLFRTWAKMTMIPGFFTEGLEYVQLIPHSVMVAAIHAIHEPTFDVPPSEWGHGLRVTMDDWLERAGAEPATWITGSDGRAMVTEDGSPAMSGAPPSIGAIVSRALASMPSGKWLPMDGDFHGVSPFFAAYRIYDPRPEVTSEVTINLMLGEGMGIPKAIAPFQFGHGNPAYGSGFRWDDRGVMPFGLVPVDPRWSFGAKSAMAEFHADAMGWTWGLMRDSGGTLCLLYETGNGFGARILDADFARRIHAGLVGPAFIAESETRPPKPMVDDPTAWRFRPVRNERVITLGIPERHAERVADAARSALMAGDMIQRNALERVGAMIPVPGALAAITTHALTMARGFRCSEVGLLTGRGTILSGTRPGWAAWHDPWHGIPDGVFGPFPGPCGMEAHLIADIDGPGAVIDRMALQASHDFGMFRRLNGGAGPESDGPLASWDPFSHHQIGSTADSLKARLDAGETSANAPWRSHPDIPHPETVDFRVLVVLSESDLSGGRYYDVHVTRAGLVRAWLSGRTGAHGSDWLADAIGGEWPAVEAIADRIARQHFGFRCHEDALDHPEGVYPPWTEGWLKEALTEREGYPERWAVGMAEHLRDALRRFYPAEAAGASASAEAFWRSFDAPHHLDLPHPLACPYEPPTVMRWMEWMPLLRIHYVWAGLWRGYALGRYVTRPETALRALMSTHATHAGWRAFWGDVARPEADLAEAGFWLSRSWWEGLEAKLMEAVGDPDNPWETRLGVKPAITAMAEALPDAVRHARSDADAILAARAAGLDGAGPENATGADDGVIRRFRARLGDAWGTLADMVRRIPGR